MLHSMETVKDVLFLKGYVKKPFVFASHYVIIV